MTKIEILEDQLKEAYKEKNLQDSRKKFLCGCNKYHTIKDCVAVQTHYWRDYEWYSGELHIVCPLIKIRNRILFETRSEIAYEKRRLFDYNPEQQFHNWYKSLFKKIEDEYDNQGANYEFYNNYYIDKNHKKFGIKIKKD